MFHDPDPMAALADLGRPFESALAGMYAGTPQVGADGERHPIDDSTRISVEEGMAIFSLCSTGDVADTLEVGLAYGFSTVYLLAALADNGGGSHTAVDPYQDVDWNGIGLTTAEGLVGAHSGGGPVTFELVPERSETALVDLARQGRSFGLTFIDGYHRFDDVLVDFTLAARLCPIGGVIVLHDMWLPSISAVASFLRANRVDFDEVHTGCPNLFAARRIDDDRRDWTHFVDFGMR
ncbi:MAG: class I SAM-dependent methyltransferase [Candidatus Nanopelagicales bacterium]